MTPTTSALTTDLYELNMVQAYLDRGEDKTAVFEFFVRRLPARRNFLLAAGLDDVLDYLETLRFSTAEIDWLKSTNAFVTTSSTISPNSGSPAMSMPSRKAQSVFPTSL